MDKETEQESEIPGYTNIANVSNQCVQWPLKGSESKLILYFCGHEIIFPQQNLLRYYEKLVSHGTYTGKQLPKRM